MYPETLVAYAGLHLIQQGDVAITTAFLGVGDVCHYMQVLDMPDLLIEGGKFMEVGREQAECVNLRCDVPGGRSE